MEDTNIGATDLEIRIGNPTETSLSFSDKLAQTIERFPVESIATGIAVGDMVISAVNFACGNPDTAYAYALKGAVLQTLTLGVLVADIAYRGHIAKN